eukprot:s627_g19.t1
MIKSEQKPMVPDDQCWLISSTLSELEMRQHVGHDQVRAEAYGARRSMLADFFDFVRAGDEATRESANNALMMLDELSPHDDSPTWDTTETEDEAQFRAQYAHSATIALQGLMATQLQGCHSGDLSPIQASNFSLMFLCTWTVLLISYSWWCMRAGPAVATGSMGHQDHAVMHLQLPPDPFVHNPDLYLEGVTTWMLKRVLGRLDRAKANGNNGKMRKYQQGVVWLQRTLARIPDADGDDRRALFRALTIDDELSEDDESPSWNAGDNMKELWIKQHYDVHSFFTKMIEFHSLETNVSLFRAFAKAFRSRSPAPSSDSNESVSDVPMETESQRYRRYMRDEQCEVSDPDRWVVWRYGVSGESSCEEVREY